MTDWKISKTDKCHNPLFPVLFYPIPGSVFSEGGGVTLTNFIGEGGGHPYHYLGGKNPKRAETFLKLRLNFITGLKMLVLWTIIDIQTILSLLNGYKVSKTVKFTVSVYENSTGPGITKSLKSGIGIANPGTRNCEKSRDATSMVEIRPSIRTKGA